MTQGIRKFLFGLFAPVALLMLAGPALAQGEPVAGSENVVIITDIAIVIFAILGGLAVGGLGAAAFLSRIKQDPEAIAALERLADRLANSYPPETRDLLLEISATLATFGELMKEILDGVPAEDKVDPDAPAEPEQPELG